MQVNATAKRCSLGCVFTPIAVCSLKTRDADVSYGGSARCSDFARASPDLPCIPACSGKSDATFDYDK